MASSFRSMLDSLMGKDRNASIAERMAGGPKDKFRDPDLCKYFLCGFCPHDLFINTKVDLGHCAGVHDEALQAEWGALPEHERKRYGYEDRFMEFLQKLLADIDRKIQRHKEKVEEQNAKNAQVDPEVRDRLSELSQQIVTTTNRMEAVSEQGDVDTASKLLQELESLKQEKDKILQQIHLRALSSGVGNRVISVCDVCSAFTMSGDTEQRILDHMTGKQHSGFLLIRETLKQLKAKRLRGSSESGTSSSLSPNMSGSRNEDGRRGQRSSFPTTSTTATSASSNSHSGGHPRSGDDRRRSRSRSRDKDRDRVRDREIDRDRGTDAPPRRKGPYYDRREREKYSTSGGDGLPSQSPPQKRRREED